MDESLQALAGLAATAERTYSTLDTVGQSIDSLVSSSLEALEGMLSGLPQTGGVWILCDTSADEGGEGGALAWRLWLAHQAGERSFRDFPAESRLAADGAGGVWLICPRERGGGDECGLETDWSLWHINQDSAESLYKYPADSEIVGDGQGGVWILCETAEDDEGDASDPEWCLWHADTAGEQKLYSYPKDSELASDGCGGLWILCETSGAGETCDACDAAECYLWHVTLSEEKKLYSYPQGSRLVGDGLGGAWLLCKTTGYSEDQGDEQGDWCLWHATMEQEESLFQYPAGSRLVGDGRGGIWILCETAQDDPAATECAGVGDWCLWHAEASGEELCLYKYPKDAKMVSDGQGALWILCETTEGGEGDASWCLWHVTVHGERNLFSYPSEAKLAA